MTRKFKIGDTVIYNEISTDTSEMTENDNTPCIVVDILVNSTARSVTGYTVVSQADPNVRADYDVDGFLKTNNAFEDGVIGWISRDHCNGAFPGETNQQAFEKQQCIIRLKNMARGGTPLNESVLETAIKLLEGVK